MSLFKFFSGLSVLVCLSSCGFQPLHQADTAHVKEETSLIKIALIPDRQGQILRNYLLDSLNSYGEPENPIYRLSIGLNITGGDYSFRRDSTAARTIITSIAQFNLVDIKTGKTVLTSSAEATTAYNIGAHSNTSAFPSIVAEKKEIERGLQLLAHEIRLQIISFLASEKK